MNNPPAAPGPAGNASPPPWQGVHHLALVTADLDATVRFYCGLLGMRLLLTRRAQNGDPHLFIDTGGGATLHFWQPPPDQVEIFRQPLGHRGYVPGVMQHLALRLPDDAAVRQLRARLQAEGVEVSDIVDQGQVRLFFFLDNNGLPLEASCWLDDLTARPVDYDDPRQFADPDPVPAVRELMARGQLDPA